MSLHQQIFRAAGNDSVPSYRTCLAERTGFHTVNITYLSDTGGLV